MSGLGHRGALLQRSLGPGAERGPLTFKRVKRRQFDGRRKAGPKGTAARKRLELHLGVRVGGGVTGVGGVTPTGVKEECSVWRRKGGEKPLVNLSEASEEQCEDRRRKDRTRLFTPGGRTLTGFNDILPRTTTPSDPPQYILVL